MARHLPLVDVQAGALLAENLNRTRMRSGHGIDGTSSRWRQVLVDRALLPNVIQAAVARFPQQMLDVFNTKLDIVDS